VIQTIKFLSYICKNQSYSSGG